MYRVLLVCFVVAVLAVNGGVALAQTQPPDLTVTLHDVAGAPLPGVSVTVRDAGATQTLAQAATDASGAATFATLMESQVRVVVAGTLSNGTTLYQPGNDADGISFLLNPLPATLALRSEADGMIVPDPAAMAREIGVPVATEVAIIPTAPIAPTVAVAQIVASPSVAADTPVTASTADIPASGSSEQIWLGVALLIFLIGAGIGILVVQRRSA
jgi:hypothetical protein